MIVGLARYDNAVGVTLAVLLAAYLIYALVTSEKW
jgi:K+-transporting ATPase KdpF subunit